MKKLVYFILLCFLVSGCKEIKNDIDTLFNEEQNKIVIALVDFSKSIPESTIDWYKEVISSELLPALKVNDRLHILPVDQAAQTSGTEILSIVLEEKNFVSSQDPPNQKQELINRRIREFLNKSAAKFSDQFYSIKNDRTKYSSRTDIIGGFNQAIKYKNVEFRNYIIVLSDMVQDTEELNLEKYLNSKPEPFKIISNLSSNDLTGTKIFILTGDQPKIGIKNFNWLKDFWTAYIQKNDGDLINYESGSLSLLKEKLK